MLAISGHLGQLLIDIICVGNCSFNDYACRPNGNESVNLAPLPSELSHLSVPSCALAISAQRHKPTPVPGEYLPTLET